MAKCEVCGCTPFESGLFRANELGVQGIFRCKKHLQPENTPDEIVEDILNIIEKSNKNNSRDN
jgi:hypothetical protein